MNNTRLQRNTDQAVSSLEGIIEELIQEINDLEIINLDLEEKIDKYTAQIDNLMGENDLLQEQLNNIE